MNKQFTANDVRRLSNRIPRSNDEIADAQEALRAFADRLEADEKAVPVAFRYLSQQSSTLAWVWSGWLDLGDLGISALHVHCKTSGDTKIEYAYAHSAPSDAEKRDTMTPRELAKRIERGEKWKLADERTPCQSQDAERLAEALRQIAVTTKGYPNASREGEIAIKALAAHSAQAQPKNVSFVRETWTEDADGDRPNLCTICGKPLRYGTRHTACAIAQAQPPADGIRRPSPEWFDERLHEELMPPPPAASVPEALRLLQSVLCDTDGNCCIRGTYEDRRTVDKALSMLAAQENPND